MMNLYFLSPFFRLDFIKKNNNFINNFELLDWAD